MEEGEESIGKKLHLSLCALFSASRTVSSCEHLQ